MGNGGGCIVVLFLCAAMAIALIVGTAVNDKEISPGHYQEVLDMDNEYTNELISRSMEDKVITFAELNAVRKRFNRTSGPQAELERHNGGGNELETDTHKP